MNKKALNGFLLFTTILFLLAGCGSDNNGSTSSHLKWEYLQDHFLDKHISQGDEYYSFEDIITETREATDGSSLITKWIDIGDGFRIGIPIYSEQKKADLTGFAFMLHKVDYGNFSWDWFDIQPDLTAIKLQGDGKLAVVLKEDASGWRIASIKVLSDFILRSIDTENDDANVTGQPPYRWSCKVLTGTQIRLME